jgi:hypothetical protein
VETDREAQPPWQVTVLTLAWVLGVIGVLVVGAFVAYVGAWASGFNGSDPTGWYVSGGMIALLAVVPGWIATGVWRGRRTAWLAGAVAAAALAVIALLAAFVTLAASSRPDVRSASLEVEGSVVSGLVLVLHLAPRTMRWVGVTPPERVADGRALTAAGFILAALGLVGVASTGLLSWGLANLPSGDDVPPPPAAVIPPPGPPFVRASSMMDGSSAAAAATDGRENTVWNAGEGAPAWWERDLKAPSTISSIELVVEQLPNGRTVHVVLVAGPGEVYREVHRFDDFTVVGQRLTFTPKEPISGVQFVRIETIASPSWVAWREIEIRAQ